MSQGLTLADRLRVHALISRRIEVGMSSETALILARTLNADVEADATQKFTINEYYDAKAECIHRWVLMFLCASAANQITQTWVNVFVWVQP